MKTISWMVVKPSVRLETPKKYIKNIKQSDKNNIKPAIKMSTLLLLLRGRVGATLD